MAQNMDTVIKPTFKKETTKKALAKGVVTSSRASPRRKNRVEDFSIERSGFPVWYRLCAIVLLGIFLLQPVTSVFASEEESQSPKIEQESEMVLETIPLEATEVIIEDGPVDSEEDAPVASSDEVSLENASTGSASEPVDAESESAENTASSSADQIQEEGEGEGSEELSESNEGRVEDNEDVEIASSTEDGSGVVEAGEQNAGTTTHTEVVEEEAEIPEIDNEEKKEAVATSTHAPTTEEIGVVMPEVNEGFNDLNRYQFGVHECVTVEDGFFYCSKGTIPKMTQEDRVYAAQDADGDFEIFISKDGVDTQVTHNLVDDNAPQYDAKSNRLAWHSLVNDRYQILVYDFANESMVQLTDETFNSMEPAMLGEKTVWQAWVKNNWEIILDDNGTRTQLTTNEVHDIDPFIRGDLISWQSQSSEGWDIKIFNVETQELTVVEGAGGASAQNPRFVLVYDSAKENGDIETMGYDLESGETIPLAAVPASVPETIPEPEHNKEKSAFVQTNPTLKNEVEGDIDDTIGTTTSAGGDDDNDLTDVVVSPPVTPEATSTLTEATSTARVVSGGMELDLRNFVASTTEVAGNDIPDLVIPARDAVEMIASSSVPE